MKPEKQKTSFTKAKRTRTPARAQHAKAAASPSGANSRRNLRKTAPKKGKSNTVPTAEELTREFLKTPAMVEHARMLDQVQASRDTGNQTVTVTVANPYAVMLEFVERHHAAAAGRAPEPLAKLVQEIVENELEDTLHWLAVAPGHFQQYRDLWNAFCDERGAPQHKIGVEEPAPEGPF